MKVRYVKYSDLNPGCLSALLSVAMLVAAPIWAYGSNKSDLSESVEDSIEHELKVPDNGFMYRYDGNPIYLHPNEYLTVTQSWDFRTKIDRYQIKYIKYDSDSYDQIVNLIDNGIANPTEIMNKLKKTYFVGDEKSCPNIATYLSDVYRSAKVVVDAMNFPNVDKRLLMGAAYDYQFIFTSWNGDRFIYQGSLGDSESVKKVGALTKYVMSCGRVSKSVD